MNTNTATRIEKLTREAPASRMLPPETQPQPDADQDCVKWERLRGILASAVLCVFAIGLWTIGILAALRPIA